MPAGVDAHAAGVVAVVVGDDDAGDGVGVDVHGGHPPCQVLPAEPCIHEDALRSRLHEDGVPPTPATQHRDTHAGNIGGAVEAVKFGGSGHAPTRRTASDSRSISGWS